MIKEVKHVPVQAEWSVKRTNLITILKASNLTHPLVTSGNDCEVCHCCRVAWTHTHCKDPHLVVHMCLCLSCLHKDLLHCFIQNPAEKNAMGRWNQLVFLSACSTIWEPSASPENHRWPPFPHRWKGQDHLMPVFLDSMRFEALKHIKRMWKFWFYTILVTREQMRPSGSQTLQWAALHALTAIECWLEKERRSIRGEILNGRGLQNDSLAVLSDRSWQTDAARHTLSHSALGMKMSLSLAEHSIHLTVVK